MNKEQLKQIIKEELRKYMNEAEPAPAQTQNQPDMLELYKKVMQDDRVKSLVQDAMAEAKEKFISALAIKRETEMDYKTFQSFQGSNVAKIKPIIDTFDVQPPAPSSQKPYYELLQPQEQECNSFINGLVMGSKALKGRDYLFAQTAGITAKQSDSFRFGGFCESILIRQFKNDSAVKQAVAKAKEQIESGDTPTAKGAQFTQPRVYTSRLGAPAKPAPKV